MKTHRWIVFFLVFLLIAAGIQTEIFAAPEIGDTAPQFELSDLHGKSLQLTNIKAPLVAVSFFAPFSKASEESLMTLQDLVVKYGDKQLVALAITKAPESKVKDFVAKKGITLRVFVDKGEVSHAYGAEYILPTTYVLGPQVKILDKVQGGGASGNNLLVVLAERELERKNIKIAQALAEKAIEKSKNDPRPRAILGYAKLKEGRIDEAERDFHEMVRSKGEAAILGKEGLAHVYWKSGNEEKAWQLANDVKERGSVHTIKGDILYAQGKTDDAVNEYKLATGKDAFGFHKASSLNKLGRIYAKNEKYNDAQKLYDRALKVDPYAIEVLSNKGVLFGKQGKWDRARRAYKKALTLDPKDEISLSLLKKAEEMLKLARESKRADRIDRLVKDLVKRYKEQKGKAASSDQWTSRPMILAFLNVDEKGLLTERAGIPEILVDSLGAEITKSGRVKVVERALLDKLLGELNLGSSELADPNTALRLGKVLAAKLLATGTVINQSRNDFFTLRMIDSETSAIPIVYSTPINTSGLGRRIHKISSELLKRIVEKYPLKGYVIRKEGDQVLVNLGTEQGVRKGMRFALLGRAREIVFKGKKLKRKSQKVGEIEISEVEPEVSYGRLIEVKGGIKEEMKIKEIPSLGSRI